MPRNRNSAKAAGRKRCQGCGGALPPQTLGQPRKWCSDECRSKTYRLRRLRPRKITTPAERILARSDRTESGCLEFQGYRNACGYGVVNVGTNRKSDSRLAHRVIWEAEVGVIPEGLNVRHKCDNPPCVNIEHLELGTHLDNMRDRDQRGRTLRGEQCRHKLTWEQVLEIRALAAEGVPYRVIGNKYGISTGHVSGIKNKTTRIAA